MYPDVQQYYNPNDGCWYLIYTYTTGNAAPPGYGGAGGQQPQPPENGMNNFAGYGAAPPGFGGFAGQQPQPPQYGMNNRAGNGAAPAPQHGEPSRQVYNGPPQQDPPGRTYDSPPQQDPPGRTNDGPPQQGPEGESRIPDSAFGDARLFIEWFVREADLDLVRSQADRYLMEGLMSYSVWAEWRSFLEPGGPVDFIRSGGQMSQPCINRAAWLFMQVGESVNRDKGR